MAEEIIETESMVQPEGGVPSNLQKLYDALNTDAVFKDWTGGSIDEFTKAYSNPDNMRKLYSAMKSDAVFKDWVGKDFEETVTTYLPEVYKKKSQVSSQGLEVSSQDLGVGGKPISPSKLPLSSASDIGAGLQMAKLPGEVAPKEAPLKLSFDEVIAKGIEPSREQKLGKVKELEQVAFDKMQLNNNLVNAQKELANIESQVKAEGVFVPKEIKDAYTAAKKNVQKAQAEYETFEMSDPYQKALRKAQDDLPRIIDLGVKFGAGAGNLLGAMSRTPAFVYDWAMANTLNPLNEALGGDKDLFTSENLAQSFGIENNLPAQYFEQRAEKMAEGTNLRYRKNIEKYIEEGNYEDALAQIGNSVAEATPATLSIMAGNMAGAGAAATILGGGGVFGAQNYQQLKKDHPEIDDQTLLNVAATQGLFEGIFENFGLNKLGDVIKGMVAKKGVELASKEIGESVGKVFTKKFAKYLGIGAEEIGSEVENTIAQNIVEKYSVNKDKGIFDNVFETIMTSMGQTSAMTTPVAFADVAQTLAARKKAIERKQQLDALNADLENPNIPAESKQIISEKIGELSYEDAADFREEKKRYDAMTAEQQSEVDKLNNDIKQINEIKDLGASEITIAALESEKEKKQAEIDKIYESIKPEEVVATKVSNEAASELGNVEDIGDVLEDAVAVDVKDTDTRLILRYDGDTIVLESIETPEDKQGKGSAKKALQKLTEQADAKGLKIELRAEPKSGEQKDKERLKGLYESFGFKGMPDGKMKREPKVKAETKAQATKQINEALKDVESTAKALEKLPKDNITKSILDIPLQPLEIGGYKRKPSEQYELNDAKSISEAYHKAKADGSNPELVKAVEEILGKPTERPKTEVVDTKVEEGSVVGKIFRDNYNRTFEVKSENTGILTLEDVDTGKILRKKKSEVLSNFKEITEPNVISNAKIISEHLPKGGELKGVTEINVSDNGEEVSYGTKTSKTSITVKGLSAEDIKKEIEFEKKVLAKSKKDAENFNEDDIWAMQGLTKKEKEDAIKRHKQSLLNNEQVEKIIIPFYEKHLELLQSDKSLAEKTGVDEIAEAVKKTLPKSKAIEDLSTPITEQNDKENKQGVSGEVGKRQEPKQAESKQVGSAKEAETSGNVQGNEKEEVELPKDAKGREVGNKEYATNKTHKVGRTVTKTTPTGQKIKGRYKIVPASELVPSHNPETFSKNENFPQDKKGKTINDRDYESDRAAKEQVVGIAQTLDGRAVSQMPIVSKEGIVYDGNNRTMSRQLAAKNQTDSEYLAALKEDPEMFGFTEEDVNSVENPTLVFEVDENLPFDTKTMGEFNASEKKGQSPIQKAISIGKRMNESARAALAEIYDNADTPSDVTQNPTLFKKAMDILVANGLIQSLELPLYMEKGVATPAGVSLLESVVMGASLDEETIRALGAESMGNIKQVILKSIPALITNATKGANSLMPDVRGAISILFRAKRAKLPVVDYLSNLSMFEEANPSLEEISLALMLDNSTSKEFRQWLNNFNNDVGTIDMFGRDTSKQGILDEQLNLITKGYEQIRKNLSNNAKQGTSTTTASNQQSEQAEPSEAEVAKKTGITPKNLRDLYKINRELFGLDRIKSLSSAIAIDRMVGAMAKCANVTKEQMYGRLEFRKDTEQNVLKADNALFQGTVDGKPVTLRNIDVDVVNGFYSPIEKNLKEYGKDKIKAKDWLNVIGKGDEAVFTGVRAFLERKDPNAMVSKQEILDYMKDNRISVVEVVKGSYKDGFLNDQWTAGAEENKGTGRIWKNNGWKVVENSKSDYSIFYPDGSQFEGSWSTKEGAFDRVRMEAPSGTTKFSQYQLEGEKENYKEVLVTLPKIKVNEGEYREYVRELKAKYGDEKPFRLVATKSELEKLEKLGKELQEKNNLSQFKSTHFSEANILVHLRMNTRTDTEGNKVLFLEEVQSDWGQKGKKEGFKSNERDNRVKELVSKRDDGTITEKERQELGNLISEQYKAETPAAPFVTDTNAWVKLGLKVALKEAVAQGADKIAWTTGEQQNERYDLSKQVDEIRARKNENGTYKINAAKDGNNVFSEDNVDAKKLPDIVGKELAEKIINDKSNEGKFAQYKGQDLKVGGKGMKGFYGSMEEGTKGIVGGVAEKLFGQKVGEVILQTTVSNKTDNPILNFRDWVWKNKTEDYSYADAKKDIDNNSDLYKEYKKNIPTQPSIDVTPALRAEVERGLALFQRQQGQQAKGAMVAADGSFVIYALTDPNVSTPLHEMAHVFEHYLTDAERSTVQEFAGTKSWTIETSEKFARGFEKYLSEGKAPNTALQKIFDKFKEWLTDIYNGIVGSEIDIELNDAMREIYAKMLGEEVVSKPKPSEAEVAKSRIEERKKTIESLKKQRNNLGILNNKGEIDGKILAEYVLLAKDYIEFGIANIKELISNLMNDDAELTEAQAGLISLQAMEDFTKEKAASTDEKYSNIEKDLTEKGYDKKAIESAIFADRNFESIVNALQTEGILEKVC